MMCSAVVNVMAEISGSTVGGGRDNKASGTYAAVLGGEGNTVSGYASVALGSSGSAEDDYAAVVSFDNSGATCESQGVGTVNICTNNGLFVNGDLVGSSAGLTERISTLESENEALRTNNTQLQSRIDSIEIMFQNLNHTIAEATQPCE